MAPRRTRTPTAPSPNPPRRSPRLHPRILHSSEKGAGMAPRRTRTPTAPSPNPNPNPRRRRARRIRRRQCGTASVLNDDMLREILLRLPPQPSSLPRVSAVCKRWLGLVTDPNFIGPFRYHHRKPPLLGFFSHFSRWVSFNPVLDPPDRIPPQRFHLGRYSSGHRYVMLDCRHVRVLMQDQIQNDLVVFDPITREQRCVAVPSEFKSRRLKDKGAAVLCAAGAGDHGHVHGACHSRSYKVVLVSTDTRSVDIVSLIGCVYSLETGVWGDLISSEAPSKLAYSSPFSRATLLGNCLYWTRAGGDHIVEFDLDKQNLAATTGPPCRIRYGHRQIIQAVDGAVGYAMLSYYRLQMWQRKINGHGVATWVPLKSIKYHTILPGGGMMVRLVGYDEDDDVAFICYEETVYSVQLKSMQSKKLNIIHSTANHCFHFKSFLAPGTAIAGGLSAADAGGLSAAEMLHIG